MRYIVPRNWYVLFVVKRVSVEIKEHTKMSVFNYVALIIIRAIQSLEAEPNVIEQFRNAFIGLKNG